jgi:4TM region of DNA translocase FtsK/SpoIIIE
MANKKKTKKKKVVAQPIERSPFWAMAGAVVLVLLAFLLLLGGFGTGGKAPIDLFKGAYWTLGWAAYLTPVALVYWGAYKFISEDRRIPLAKLTSMLAVLVFASSWFDTAFASKSSLGNWAGGHGGTIGSGIGNVVLSVLDTGFVTILCLHIAGCVLCFRH